MLSLAVIVSAGLQLQAPGDFEAPWISRYNLLVTPSEAI